MELNDELKQWFRLYTLTFGEPVPLSQVGNRENEELIDAIQKSIEAQEDLIPKIFGFVTGPGIYS